MNKAKCKKKKYKSADEAIRIASMRLGSKSSNVPMLRVYYCKECNRFHLTKQPLNGLGGRI